MKVSNKPFVPVFFLFLLVTSVSCANKKEAATPAVVHIRIYFNTSVAYGASGSGVIISKDGYIATNNHVVENATKIDVTLPDKRTFAAKLMGRDPNTDLALIKIDADSLPVIKLGNSDIVDAALLSAQSGMIRIFAIAPDGSKVVFDFSLGT